MSLTFAYGALITGVVVWLLLVRKLSAKPWQPLATPAPAAELPPGPPPARVGLWVFLAVVTSLFGLFLSAYYMRMGGHGIHAAGEVASGAHGALQTDWIAVQDPGVLWLNTAVLIAASLAMQYARTAAAGARIQATWTSLMIGGLLTLLFLGGQYYAWRVLQGSEVFSPRNPAAAFFYLLTAVHALHLLGGLLVWARTLARLRTADLEPHELFGRVSLSVQLCSVYWHYLLLVWLGVFAVLLST